MGMYNLGKLSNLSGSLLAPYMQHSIRTITSSDAKANLGEVLASLRSRGPVEITRNGRPVGLLTPPPTQAQSTDKERLDALATAYSKGLISWRQISDETDAGFGELLVALGLKKLPLPKVMPKNRPEQSALLEEILNAASKRTARQ